MIRTTGRDVAGDQRIPVALERQRARGAVRIPPHAAVEDQGAVEIIGKRGAVATVDRRVREGHSIAVASIQSVSLASLHRERAKRGRAIDSVARQRVIHEKGGTYPPVNKRRTAADIDSRCVHADFQRAAVHIQHGVDSGVRRERARPGSKHIIIHQTHSAAAAHPNRAGKSGRIGRVENQRACAGFLQGAGSCKRPGHREITHAHGVDATQRGKLGGRYPGGIKRPGKLQKPACGIDPRV